MFTSFPGGVAGSALLLLRAVSGLVIAREGLTYFRAGDAGSTVWSLVAGMLAAGALLAIGLMTPVAGVAGAVIVGAVATGVIDAPASTEFHAGVSVLLLESILIAVMLQGPGAFSIDACLFGRREIIIPLRWE